jgi:hypothetical protein
VIRCFLKVDFGDEASGCTLKTIQKLEKKWLTLQLKNYWKQGYISDIRPNAGTPK